MERSDMTGSQYRVVSDPVLQPKDRLVYWVLTVLGCAAIAFFLFSWFKLPAWGEHSFAMVVLFAILAVFLISNLGRWWVVPFMKRPRAVPPKPGWKVAVVTTFVSSIEPLELLERTMKALVALDYPHDTWVLDEENDDRVKQLCAAIGAHHFSRKHDPQYQSEVGMFRKASKHGNYNAWLHAIGFERYEILAAFDPDHVPDPSFLMKVLGYFDDSRIGYVQAAQVYANQQNSFIARGAAEETYEFYSVVQMASYGNNYPLIIGCHNTHRMSALRECGGFASHDADDLLLTLLYHNGGWQGVYVPEILARGLAPVDWPIYLNQQRRWTRALLDIKFRIAPSICRNLSPAAAFLNAVHGINYFHRSILLPLFLILVALMLVLGETLDVATTETTVSGVFAIIMLHIWERYRQQFYLNGEVEQGVHWRAWLLQFAKWPYQLTAAADVLSNRRFPYVSTPKAAVQSASSFVLWPHLATLGLLGLAWGIGLAIHETIPVSVQLCAGMVVVLTLGLMATEWKWVSRHIANR
jgi:cellulose synthase/poly-beta-1,6-N-acetylglucosamine synthase-like glycosyltransferase